MRRNLFFLFAQYFILVVNKLGMNEGNIVNSKQIQVEISDIILFKILINICEIALNSHYANSSFK
jgi:hypothetical protein